MSTTIKAQISEVKVGHLSLEGLLGSDGEFYIAVPQVSERFDVPQKHASRDFKALLGNGLTLPKLSITGTRITVSAMKLSDFEILIAKLDRKGNKFAQDFRDDLASLSLKQLFCDSFGIKFDLDDRQEFLKVRQESKALFWELTEQIQNYIKNHPSNAPEFTYYSNAFDSLNMALFGKKSKTIREELGITTGLNRDSFGTKALINVINVQRVSAILMEEDINLKPVEAIKIAVHSNRIKLADYQK